MRRPSYPLEAARSLRKNEVDAAKEQLARATAAVVEAERALVRRKEALAAHDSETRLLTAREQARDGAGRTIAEMMRARAYEARRREEAAELSRAVNDAVRDLERANEAAEQAREAVAQARAAHEAVERNHQAWLDEARRKAEARSEAEVEDVVAARRDREKVP